MYKYDRYGSIIRLSNGDLIPIDNKNTDYQEVLAWVALGNTIAPADPIPPSYIWEQIKQKRTQIQHGGVLVGTKWFHSDDSSRIQQLGLLMMGASIPANLQWKTMDGSFILMTQILAGQVFQAVAAHDSIAFANAESHRVAMEASSVPADYDFSTGWPAIYTPA